MARRRRSSEANIWPGFVDGLSTLLLVLMFVLSIFVVGQFYLGAKLTSVKDELATKDSELARLTARINELAEQLGLAQSEKDQLQAQILALESTISDKDTELAALTAALATSQAAVAASAEELEAEKALSEDQKSQIATLNAQLAALRKQLASLQEALDAAEAKDIEQQAQIENLSQRLNAALARKVQELQEVRSRFFEALRAALGDRTDIKVVGDRFIFESDILFSSCSATIGEPGKLELNKLASILLDIQDDIPSEIAWVLRVDGHADAAPLGPSCMARFDSNLDLSAQRAIAVVNYLKQRGVPAKRMMATGSGSEWPLVSGYSAGALAQNRRIEFKLDAR
ncbi:MAG: peptidoglycan -binding protein [Parvularculaceae bacterium]|nr:peptidoglycan -binding protein [Parvularculaceae bacterium]